MYRIKSMSLSEAIIGGKAPRGKFNLSGKDLFAGPGGGCAGARTFEAGQALRRVC